AHQDALSHENFDAPASPSVTRPPSSPISPSTHTAPFKAQESLGDPEPDYNTVNDHKEDTTKDCDHEDDGDEPPVFVKYDDWNLNHKLGKISDSTLCGYLLVGP
ncbi:unnamed protein product, partial [Owenia fusiformis]